MGLLGAVGHHLGEQRGLLDVVAVLQLEALDHLRPRRQERVQDALARRRLEKSEANVIAKM